MAHELGYPVIPDFLTNFDSFHGSADDHDWKRWTCSTADRFLSERELSLIDEAENLVEQEGSDFGDRLRALRADRPDLRPLSSGFKIIPWLLML